MNILLSFLKKIFTNRFSTVVLLMLAVSVFIWMVGPNVGLRSVLVRIVCVGVVLQVGYAYIIYQWMKSKKSSENVQGETSSAGVDARKVIDQKVKEIRGTFESNVQILLSHENHTKLPSFLNFFRFDAALYLKPWYLVIGSKGSGKSDLLRNCGLHDSVIEKTLLKTKGVGNTRQSEWWFFDNAVFLDTPGEYVTDLTFKFEWDTLLNLIEQYRTRLPINGVIITVSMEEVIGQPDKIEQNFLNYRKRIDEINRKFKLNIPVQVVFTHMDCLEGCEGFTSRLNERAKNQAMGFPLNKMAGMNTHESRVKTIGEGMALMRERFTLFATQHLSVLRNAPALNAVCFSLHFKTAVEPVLVAFQALSLPNSYLITPNLAGVWFTAKDMFIKNMFERLVSEDKARDAVGIAKFKQALSDQASLDMSKVSHNRHMKSVRRKCLAAVCATGILILPTTVVWHSYSLNKELVDTGLVLTEALSHSLNNGKYVPDVPSVIADQITQQMALYQQILVLRGLNAHVPLSYKIAQYKGHDVFLNMQRVLLESLNNTVLRITKKERTMVLQQHADQWLSLDEYDKERDKTDYYQSLRSYLMLYVTKHRMLDELKNTVILDCIKHDDAVKKVNSEQLGILIGFYLTQLQDGEKPNDALVAKARHHLFSIPSVAIFDTLLRCVENTRQFPSLKVKDLISRFGNQWLRARYELSSLYTVESWESFVKPTIKRMMAQVGEYDWVLDKTLDTNMQNNIEDNLRAHYFAKYKKSWELFISGIEIQPFNGLVDTHSKLEELCNVEGPLVELINVTAKHTQALSSTIPELRSWDIVGLTPTVLKGVEKPVNEHLNEYLNGLHAARLEINQIIDSSNTDRVLHAYVEMVLNPRKKMQEHGQPVTAYDEMVWIEHTGLQKAAGAIHRSTLSSKGTDGKRAFSNLLLSVVRESWRAIVKESILGLQDKWHSEVLDVYHKKLAGTFPFIDSEKDASMNDVMDFFHPDHGKLWIFVKKDLEVYLKQEGNSWKPRIWLGVAPEFSTEFLDSINHASRITKAMFREDKREPSFQFELYPEASAALTEFSFETCDQVYLYQNDPEEWHLFEWSCTEGKQGTKIVAVEAKQFYEKGKTKTKIIDSPKTLELQQPGAWGLLRLLKQATVVREEHDQGFWTQWALKSENGDPLTVTFRFKSLKSDNLLEELVLNTFKLSKEVLRDRDL